MPKWKVSIGIMTVEAESGNWLGALGQALPQVGMEMGSLGRLVCAIDPDGTVRARDPVTDMEILIEQVDPPEAASAGAAAPPSLDMPSPSIGEIFDAPEEAPATWDDATMDRPEAPAPGALSDRMDDLFMMTGDIAEASSMRGACETALNILTQLVPADAGAVFVRTRGGDSLRFTAALGPRSKSLIETNIPIDQGIAGFAYQFGMGIIIEDVARDVRHYKRVDRSTGYHTRSLLAVPIRTADGAALGCMELLNPPRRFVADDLEVARMVAQSLGEYLRGAIGG